MIWENLNASDVQGKGKREGHRMTVGLIFYPSRHKEKSPSEQYIFQRHTPTTTEPSGHAEPPLLYAELGLTDSETEFDKEVSPEINAGTQDEGQARPNPGEQDKGQAGPNPGIQDEGQAGSTLKPQARWNPVSSLLNLDKELQLHHSIPCEKSQETKSDISNTEAEKSLELDYSNQCLADQEEARKKRRKRRDAPRSPPGSPPSQPPPPAGASGAPGTLGAPGSSQFPPPPPPPSTGTSGISLQ
ncbi:hypothetical protein Tco_0222513 [Tanacetum coccineum]